MPGLTWARSLAAPVERLSESNASLESNSFKEGCDQLSKSSRNDIAEPQEGREMTQEALVEFLQSSQQDNEFYSAVSLGRRIYEWLGTFVAEEPTDTQASAQLAEQAEEGR